MGNLLGLAAGVGVGAAAMYLLDPIRGKRRRAIARDEAGHAVRVARRAGTGRLRDAFNRVAGLATEGLARLKGEPGLDDDVLAQRVRSRLGHIAEHPEGIDVAARSGTITLTGWAFVGEIDKIVKGVSRVRGVAHVDPRLETRGSAVMAPGHHGPNLGGA